MVEPLITEKEVSGTSGKTYREIIKPEGSKSNNKEKIYGVNDVEEDEDIPNFLDQWIDSDSEDKYS